MRKTLPWLMAWWVLLAGAPWAQADPAAGLNILLTNDDGWNSVGLAAVATALRGDGHRVTVVAPLDQQSGTGMKITTGELALVEQQPGVWSVAGSPADAVGVALQHVMADDPPDLVVSGANFGQNLGSNTVISGTVGAAMMASLHGVPAIAVSVGLDLAEAAAEPRFASTVAAFPGAARLTARLVARLAANRGSDLLPSGQVINVNYPAVPRPAGVMWARASAHGGFRMRYDTPAANGIKARFEHDQAGQAESTTDTGRFAAGYVTLSILTPDWNADANAAAGARGRLDDIDALLVP